MFIVTLDPQDRPVIAHTVATYEEAITFASYQIDVAGMPPECVMVYDATPCVDYYSSVEATRLGLPL